MADRILAGGSATASDIGASLAELVATSSGKDVLSARYRQISASLVPDLLIPYDGAVEMICELTRLAIPAAILTNAFASVAARAASIIGFAGRLLAADDTGFAKPAADAYAMIVSTLRLPANTIYYVSADPVDIAAARAAGLVTVYFDHSGQASPSSSEAPTHTIESLSALLPILAAPYTRGVLALRYVFHSALAWRTGHFVPGVEYGHPLETDE